MSQRDSGYERKERDLYETPVWVTEALLPHIPARVQSIWEPACGTGKMARALSEGTAYIVRTSDVDSGIDFLKEEKNNSDAIITNPPYALAGEFIWHAICLTRGDMTKSSYDGGVVAMLLRTDFDHAKTRLHLFEREQFSKKVALTKRIRWFEGPVPCKHCGATGFKGGLKCRPCNGKGEKVQGPSENHAWFIWDWRHKGPPTLAYGP